MQRPGAGQWWEKAGFTLGAATRKTIDACLQVREGERAGGR
jgi:hypothetical protein